VHKLREIEKRWQEEWRRDRVFEADPEPGKPKFFLTVAFPYVNMAPHIGHCRTYTITDVYARFKRMQGYNVLFPLGFHYTGTPIIAISKRLSEGDKGLYRIFTEIYHVPEEKLEEFRDPLRLADYFKDEWRAAAEATGFSIDWRRSFTSIDPTFSRFIHWQFEKLREKGYIKIGTHPVAYCPKCGNPVGQHDTKGDVEAEIGEYVLLKFRVDGEPGKYMVAGTLRPETIFGVTNVWVNPNAIYVEARVDGETWIISEAAAVKLGHQGHQVDICRHVRGSELVGKWVIRPQVGGRVPVLPATFVDPENVTGVVMSVPGHAPYDYVAIKELKQSRTLDEKLQSVVSGLKVIQMIKVEGLQGPAGVLLTEERRVVSQDDPRLEEITRQVYSLEYHRGVMAENTGRYAGMRVSDAREAVKEEMAKAGMADLMYEVMNGPVYCRCGAKVIVKILENQWFIDYGNPEWKKLAYEWLETKRIVPPDLIPEFRNVIEWVREKACARMTGLGTRFPWDEKWVIESLSDSTIYMAYYTFAHVIRDVPPEKLTREVFDYVLLGVGSPEEVAENSGLDVEILKEMRRQFSYWYPLDSRHSGRDLVPNHLVFFVFNHVAVFPRNLWPEQIVVNGFVLMEGKKMSKSLGNILPLREAVEKYGADTLRLTLTAGAEILQDADFSDSLANSMLSRLRSFYEFIKLVAENKKDGPVPKLKLVDRWLLSVLQKRVRAVTDAFESLRIREAVQQGFFLLNRDVEDYLSIVGKEAEKDPERKSVVNWVLSRVADVWVRLMAPVIPHLAEEAWKMLGGEGYVSKARWPEYDEAFVDVEAELGKALVDGVIEDVKEILSAINVEPSTLHIYVAGEERWELLKMVIEASLKGLKLNEIIRNVIKEAVKTGLKPKEAVNAIRSMHEAVARLPRDLVNTLRVFRLDEKKILEEYSDYIESTLKLSVKIYGAGDRGVFDPLGKSRQAIPLKPALYLE